MNFLSFFIQAVRTGMSFLLGSTGETLTEKSGHLNLGIPGIMCVGAASGCLAEAMYLTSVGGEAQANKLLIVLIPILVSFLAAMLLGVLYCFLTVTLRANQNVTGLALTTLGVGIANYLSKQFSNGLLPFASATKYFTAKLPFYETMKASPHAFVQVLGDIFFSYGVLVYLAIIIALIVSFVLTRTRTGLNLRAVGENPATADAAGINVTRYRYLATMAGSGIAGLGGLCYIKDNLNGNWEYTVDAVGWLAIALVIFTIWRPNIAILGSIVFGGLYIVGNYIIGISFQNKELIKMLPYVITIIVLIFTSFTKKKEIQPPQSLGLSYFREER